MIPMQRSFIEKAEALPTLASAGSGCVLFHVTISLRRSTLLIFNIFFSLEFESEQVPGRDETDCANISNYANTQVS